MKKISSTTQLEDTLQSDLAWRRKELSDIYLAAISSKDKSDRQGQFARAGIVLAYAHLEGFSTLAIRSYFSYVRSKSLKYSELAGSFIAIKLSRMVGQETHKASYYGAAVTLLTRDIETAAELPEPEMISARSNLSYSQFSEMLYCVNIDPLPFALRENFFDVVLLKRRNEIAHGEFRRPSLSDYREVHIGVIELLDELDTLLVKSAVSGAYRA